MKRPFVLLAGCGALALSAFAAPKVDPVAEGYPDWQGVVEKNYITGRRICPSDLRQRVAVIIDLDAGDQLHGQFLRVGSLVGLNGLAGFHAGENWETWVLPRDVIVLLCVHGAGKDRAAVLTAMKTPKDADAAVAQKMAYLRHASVPIYEGVTFTGAPDSAGKRPFVYVMGPSGKTPLFEGTFSAGKVEKEIRTAVSAARKKLASGAPWKPFLGTVAEPQFFPIVAKTLAAEKPFPPVEKALLKDVVAKDPLKATEAQVLYDALNQTRSELVMRIQLEVGSCPHRAYYDYRQLGKFWPGEKNKLKDVMARMKSIPDAGVLADMFCKAMQWTDPEFMCKNASDAKKIVGELNKMKKTLEKLKESKTLVIQNGAQLLDAQIDELIAVIPTRVPEK